MVPPAERLVPSVPRLTLNWLAVHPEDVAAEVEGTAVLADLAGFTALSERLAAMGKEGAERLSDVIDSTFASLLEQAYAEGGRLLAFGGDALLLLFSGEDHTRRGCVQRYGCAARCDRLEGTRLLAESFGCACRSASTRARSPSFSSALHTDSCSGAGDGPVVAG